MDLHCPVCNRARQKLSASVRINQALARLGCTSQHANPGGAEFEKVEAFERERKDSNAK